MDLVLARIKPLSQASKLTVFDLDNLSGKVSAFVSASCNLHPCNNSGICACDTLLMDDNDLYYDFLNTLETTDLPFCPLLLSKINEFVYQYFGPSLGSEPLRIDFYDTDTKHSLKELKNTGIAMCSERATLAHNLLKFLGVDSQIIFGTMNNIAHCYVTFSPNQDKYFLYDPSNAVHYELNNQRYRIFKLAELSSEDMIKFDEGNSVNFDYQWIENFITKSFGEHKLEKEECSYSIRPYQRGTKAY